MSAFSIQVKGVEQARTAELAAEFGGIVKLAAENGLDLRDLESVVIAWDYSGELKSLEQGGRPDAIGHTDNEFGLGVAKALTVERDGGKKTTIVLNAVLALDLIGDDEVRRNRVIAVALHELWHVHERRVRREIWAKGPMAAFNSAERYFLNLAEILWEEYSANRIAATLDPEYGSGMAESLKNALTHAQESVDAAIDKYRLDGNLNGVFDAVRAQYDFPIRAVAYLLGHLHGSGQTIDAVGPGLRAEIASSAFADFWPTLEIELRRLHERFPDDWTDQSIFRPIVAELSKLLLRIGIEVAPDDERVKVRIPFRPADANATML